MSLNAGEIATGEANPRLATESARGSRLGTAIWIALAGLIVALAGLALVSALIGVDAATQMPVKNPFGVGPREPAAGTGLVGWILSVQSDFYRRLTMGLRAAREDGSALAGLLWIGFLYGVFHAAGPGHGKAVIAGYIMSSEKALARGISLSFGAAVVQALVAIGLVGVMTVLLKATAMKMQAATNAVEIASFAAVALLGFWLLARKSRRMAALISPGPAVSEADDCGHYHGPDTATLERKVDWKSMLGVMFAAGTRPCSGAIILMVFAVAQQMVGAGIAAVAVMSLGTAITTSALAALAVFAKRTALNLASRGGRFGLLAGAGLEVLAAAFLAVLGLGLAAGFWAFGGQS